jgi:hypothetical protein
MREQFLIFGSPLILDDEINEVDDNEIINNNSTF